MFVDEVNELILGFILSLAVVLGLAESDEILGAQHVVHINFDLSSHTFTIHSLSSVTEEIEIINTTDNLEVVHNALGDKISLFGVSKDSHGLVQTCIRGREMSLNRSAQHLSF
jgi:hypothetical protein